MITTKPSKLQPLPIGFDEERHRYTWQPTGEVMAYSVTEIVGASKDAHALRNIEATRHVWEPRGLAVHAAMEAFANGADPNSLLGTEYDAWVKPLIEHPFWEFSEVLATEFRLCDRRKSIGGSFDLLAWDTLGECTVLIDLKTQGPSGRPYDTSAQLGGYVAMGNDQLKLKVDQCCTLWCKPGETTLGEDQQVDHCLMAWDEAYDYWHSQQETL